MPAVLALCFAIVVIAQTPADTAVRRVLDDAATRAAFAALDRTHDQLVADTIALTEIPAPPLREEARARAFKTMLEGAGLTSVETDAQGNILGLRRGVDSRLPAVVIAAHLDTAFPDGTDVRVTQDGTRLRAPGVGDNARSLAVLVAIARAMDAAAMRTAADIVFAGTVGEEGAGDLRGVRYLFNQGAWRGRIGAFIAVDGTGPGSDIVDAGIGVRRYRVQFTGPGGHSDSSFGIVNPVFALGSAIDRLLRVPVPGSPRTTLNVGVIGGGTSVNTIPTDAWADIDLRSESPAGLDRLDRQFRDAMQAAADDENRRRSTALGKVLVRIDRTGNRPAGRTPASSRLVATAEAVIRASGLTPTRSTASTDANLPMSLGIPAIAIESGATGDRVHTVDEWIDVEKSGSLGGVRNALALVLAMAERP